MTDTDTDLQPDEAPAGVATIESPEEAEALADAEDAAAEEQERTIHDERAITASEADQSAIASEADPPPFYRSKGAATTGSRSASRRDPRLVTITANMAGAGGKHHVEGFRAWKPMADAIQASRLGLQLTIGRRGGPLGDGSWCAWEANRLYCVLPEDAADWLDYRLDHPHSRRPLEFCLPERQEQEQDTEASAL